MKNKPIVFEGIDGVGKSTVISKLKKELLSLGIKVVCYEDIEDKKKGFNAIKPFIQKHASIESSLLFYLASSIYKSEALDKLLKRNWVLCDRYVYSTLAYHHIRGAKIEPISCLKELPIRKPDFTFLLKVKESIRNIRIHEKKVITKQDLKKKHKRNQVYKMENELLRFKPIVVDNSGDIEDTLKKISKIIFS